MHILLLGKIYQKTCANLSIRHNLTTLFHPPVNLCQEVLRDIEIVVVRSPFKVDSPLLDLMPQVRVVIRAGSGSDSISLPDLASRSIKLRFIPSASISVAELAFGLLLGVMRQVSSLNQSLQNGIWRKYEALGCEIAGKTISILGFGQIGQHIAQIASGYGANILLIDRSPGKPEKIAAAERYGGCFCDLDIALPATDILILCCPLTDQTKNLIGRAELLRMKSGSFLINVARGGLLDYGALEWALNIGHLKGVGLDVFPVEPPGDMHLLKHSLVLATPHIGAQTEEAMDRIGASLEKIVEEYECEHGY